MSKDLHEIDCTNLMDNDDDYRKSHKSCEDYNNIDLI